MRFTAKLTNPSQAQNKDKLIVNSISDSEPTAVAQWVIEFAPQPESEVFEFQSRQT